MAEEKEDLNEFKRWDAVGAAGFLAFVPVVMCFVFSEHDVKACITLAAVALVVTAAVLVLTYVFPERFIGRIVNLAGNVLAAVYLVIAVVLFMDKWTGENSPMNAAPSKNAQEGGPEAPAPPPAPGQ